MSIISNILVVLSQTLLIYSYLLIISVLLTWFPNLDRTNPIVSNLYAITDPYLNLFRGIIPPIGGTIDISPILAFLLLNVVQSLIGSLQIAAMNTGIQLYG